MTNVPKDIRKAIIEKIKYPELISGIWAEGPKIIIYTRNPAILLEDGDLIRNLAKEIRKRVEVRPDPDVLMDMEEAKKKILEIVPQEADITSINFDPVMGKVIIEARKPGLVIGKKGELVREITSKVRWTPEPIRTPPIESKTIKRIRNMLQTESKERRSILRRIGKLIHRESLDKTSWIRITGLGGFREVGRSAILFQTGSRRGPESRILLDCGINVAHNDPEKAYPYLNAPEVSRFDMLDAVVITHAHLDHSGFVPYLYKYGYDGPVYCTPPTRDLVTLLVMDYLEIIDKSDRGEGNPPYTKKEVKEFIKHCIPLEYGETTDITPEVRLTLHNAGHILGSAIVHLHVGEGLYNVVYTGDFKFGGTRLLESAKYQFPRVETLISESTYGGSEDIQPPRKEAEKELVRTVINTLKRGGKVLVPVMGVGRAQEVMVVLEEYARSKLLEDVTVFLDGMIWEATAIHTAYPNYMRKEIRDLIFQEGMNPFLSEIFEKVEDEERRHEVIEEKGPFVILSTSGMMTGGPVIEYFRELAIDERNTIVFVAYQAEGSLGREVQKGKDVVQIGQREGKGEYVEVKMEVKTIDGFSGHSDRRQLMGYIGKIHPRPERVIFCHGENSKCLDIASSVYKGMRLETRCPQNLETIRLK